MALSAFAPAKLNLFLHVGPPAADGYHPLCSLMAFADVGDRVSAYAAAAPEVRVSGPFAAALAGEADNLVLRAAKALLAKADGPRPPLGLLLEKALPVAAGLGGGSSDAGAALRLLREILDIGLSDPELEALAAGLGADGAACLWGRPVLAQGRGEQLSPAPSLPPLDAVLVNPKIPVATAAVYAALDASGGFGAVEPPPMPDGFENAAELAAWLSFQRNDLQAPALSAEPRIADALALIAEEPETLLARMSGSGPTCFALCPSDLEAEALSQRVAALRPGWWVRRCRVGGPWEAGGG